MLWVDSPVELLKAVDEMAHHRSVAVDAEMDSYFVYHTKLCLVQISAGETDYLIDSLALDDLTPLNRVFQDPEIRKVVHAGENDIPYFRGRGVTVVNLFDTHLAARLLELESKSLAGLVDKFFSVSLAKDQQRADWRLRPLPVEQIAYAREDTAYLNELADILEGLLKDQGLEIEAEQAFANLERFEVRAKEWDPDGWVKIKGARELTGPQRSALAALFDWRERLAEKQDLALFRVVGNGLLLALARKRFVNAADLKAWAKSPWLTQHATELVELITRAQARGGIPFPESKKRQQDGLSPEDEALFSRLRDWRNQESRRREVAPERVMSNRQLKQIIKNRPRTLTELSQVEGLEPWRGQEYGETVLALLKSG